MIAINARRLGAYLLLAFALVSAALTWWQVVEARSLAARQDNPQLIAARRSAPRGSIFDAQGKLLVSSSLVDGIARRRYFDSAFAQLIGYASLRYGATGMERAWEDLLTGRADPDPLRQLIDQVLGRQPQPKDLTLTIDQRLQDFAAAQLGDAVGSVVAIDPSTGAILAMVSSPRYNATGWSADPASAEAAFDAVANDPNNPFVDRARQGHYTSGSILKVLTASAALDSGAITPQTTFPDQPAEEIDGFVVNGFTIHEHRLGKIKPGLWSLSEALQASSNIFFAHVGLAVGGDRFLEYARRFGFCAPLVIGDPEHPIPVDPSYVSAPAGTDCAAFADEVELASAAFGQGKVAVTPLQMALLAATIANGGTVPDPYVVKDVRAHAADPTAGPLAEILQAFLPGSGHRAISPAVAAQVRSAMVDAVEGPIGRLLAGPGAVTRYGVSGVLTAGKTGTAERADGLPSHSWFIGFAPAQDGAVPAIAVAVILEAGGGRASPIGGAVLAEWLKLLGLAG